MNEINEETGIPFPSLNFTDLPKILLGKKDSISDSLKRVITSYGFFSIALIGGVKLIKVGYDLNLDDFIYLGRSITLSSFVFNVAGDVQSMIMLLRIRNYFLK